MNPKLKIYEIRKQARSENSPSIDAEKIDYRQDKTKIKTRLKIFGDWKIRSWKPWFVFKTIQ